MAKSQIEIEFKLLAEQFNKAMSEIKGNVSNLTKEFRLEQEQLRLNGTEKEKLESRTKYLSERLKLQTQEVKATEEQLKKAKEMFGENSKEVQQLEGALLEAQRKEEYFKNELQLTTTALDDQKNKLKQVTESIEKFGSKMKEVGGNLKDFGKQWTMKVTTPIVAGGTLMVKAASDFESAFAGVRKTVDASDEEFDVLEQGIRDMAKELPTAASNIAEVTEAAGQLGIKNEHLLSFTRVMIDLGEATNLTATEGASQFARFANIVGMNQGNFDRLGSTTVALGNNFATTEAEIVNMSMGLAAAGSQVGLTEAEIMGFATALSSVGVEAQAGGTAFSKVMIQMQLAVETNSDALEDWASVAGMSGEEFQKAFKEDATSAILAFIDGLSTAEDRGMSAIKVLDDMGISEVRLRDTLLRASGATEVFNNAIDIGSKAWEENTALTEEAEQRYATFASQMAMFKNRITDLRIEIGEKLMPYVLRFAEWATEQVEKFGALDESTQMIIIQIAALAAVVGPLLIVLGTLISSVGSILTLAPAFGAVFAALISPIGLVVAAIAAVIATGVLLIKNWEDIWESIKNFAKIFPEAWNEIKEGATEAWNNIKETVSSAAADMAEKANAKATELKEKVSQNWNEMKTNLSNRGREIKENAANAWGDMKDRVSTTMSGMKDNVKSRADEIKNSMSNAWNSAKSKTSDVFTGIQNAIKDKINGAKDAVKGAIDAIKGFFNFSWSLPSLKLPRISISGSFSLNPPRVPSFGISWYKDGAIFTKATLFNTPYGLKGVGEAGPEAVLPISKLAGMIRDVIDSDRNLGEAYTNTMRALEIIVPVSIDGRQVAVVTAPYMDVELGNMRGRRSR